MADGGIVELAVNSARIVIVRTPVVGEKKLIAVGRKVETAELVDGGNLAEVRVVRVEFAVGLDHEIAAGHIGIGGAIATEPNGAAVEMNRAAGECARHVVGSEEAAGIDAFSQSVHRHGAPAAGVDHDFAGDVVEGTRRSDL